MTSTPPTTDGVAAHERRNGRDRRTRTFWGVLFGGISPRRRVPRRRNEPHLAAIDWFHPQWLAVAVLIVLHDLNLAVTYADHLVVMDQGQIIAQGDVMPFMDSTRSQMVREGMAE